MSRIRLAVEMKGIVRRFPGVLANDYIDFDLHVGEIHALLGENGAGKTTLMNVLAGLHRPDEGEIRVKNTPVRFSSPRDAIKAGIGMIHQHFMLIDSLNVTENILLGIDEPRLFLRMTKHHQQVAELQRCLNLMVDPKALVAQLSVGEKQRVELLRVLYHQSDIVIMDEPTAALAPQEIDSLFQLLRVVVAKGASVVLISHKLGEILSIADRVTVLRQGKVVASDLNPSELSQTEIARFMTGREVPTSYQTASKSTGERILIVEDLYANSDQGVLALRGVSIHAHAGEIVGIASVAGNGQNELAQVIMGLRRCIQGRVLINGQEVQNHSARVVIDAGVSYIPEERTQVGTIPDLSITDNLILKRFRDPPLAKNWVLDQTRAREFAERLLLQYDITAPDVNTPVRFLSGGNVQRIILARETSDSPILIIAVRPTRGLDISAVGKVRQLLAKQTENGASILLISDDLDELIALSDRIYVLYRGRIVGEVCDGNIDAVGLMMTGVHP